MRQTCSALVITCMDFRLQSPLRAYLRAHAYEGDYDLLSLVGGVKGLAESSEGDAGQVVLDGVAAASRLHQISEVVIVAHEDCRAYGGSRPGVSPDEELAERLHDVRKAEALIAARVPGLTFTTLLAVIQGEGFRVVGLPPEVSGQESRGSAT